MSTRIERGEPTLAAPVSQACTQAQMEEVHYTRWCNEIQEVPRSHRKQWEFCYILRALEHHGMLKPGQRGLGFGVGEEPLTAAMAVRGVQVLATDLAADEAKEKGWVDTDQHARNKEMLNTRGICSPDIFDEMVEFRHADMNAIDGGLKDFHFCWSACALEHLGSIELGLQFIENSIECLRPGGIAVHTTEFNCLSDEETLDNDSTVLFRRRDLLLLADRLSANGHEIIFNFNLGDQPLDQHIDVPPYSANNHLKLALAGFVSTSFGIVVIKGN